MDDESIQAIVSEIAPLLSGRVPGKIFQLESLSLAIDFGLREHGYLLISVEPALPRLHLIKRRVRDLEKQSIAPAPFARSLRKELTGTRVHSTEKESGDRVVRLQFAGQTELGVSRERTLVAQLTGPSANLFLLDERAQIIHQSRASRTPGQQLGEQYRPPRSADRRVGVRKSELALMIRSDQFDSPSRAADAYFSALISRQILDAKLSTARGELRKKITRHRKLLQQLQNDLASHGDAEAQRRLGDLLLANISTAERTGNGVKLIDYFSPDQPVVEIEVDKKLTLAQEAERRFASYSRSKRAVRQIQLRIEAAQRELDSLDADQQALERLVSDGDVAVLEKFLASTPSAAKGLSSAASGRHQRKKEQRVPGTRRYVSSDGFEILVGRAAHDNDHLTFKVARPNDLWLHAADYPGSHVVVRNSTRKEIPHRTIIEAAQLAAHFSQASKDPKVGVHYTPRKFLSKPKGAAPGLVRLSRFKSITVKPGASLDRQ
jgi:predicted ribosome quality control (RQC) complex YloA/Tae2 family protein